MTMDDWLPSLHRAAEWNQWTNEEKLIQLAGHLQGRALQEWNLLARDGQLPFDEMVQALRGRLEPRTRTLAAQDFRHTSQSDTEKVSDFIRRLERTFMVTYGQDQMSLETMETLLHSQFQEGLRYSLMKAPAVSGAQTYKELCMAAKNEEKRLEELKKRQEYGQVNATQVPRPPKRHQTLPASSRSYSKSMPGQQQQQQQPQEAGRCYQCGRTGHYARDCKGRKSESTGKVQTQHRTGSKKVQSMATRQPKFTPQDFLLSSESEGETSEVRAIWVQDKGSHSMCAHVEVQGVPAYGIIDSGADITIIGGSLFKKVATVAKLRKREFKPADKTPRNYDGHPFTLDGRMDLELTFKDRTMCTPVYIKLDAEDQLLLSEGVCCQLEIIAYHPDVEVWRGKDTKEDGPTTEKSQPETEARVPTVRVRLLQATRLLPQQSVVVRAQADPRPQENGGPLLVEPDQDWERCTGLQVDAALVSPSQDGCVDMVVTNPSGFTQTVDARTEFGTAQPAL